jgi:hypothetical protein
MAKDIMELEMEASVLNAKRTEVFCPLSKRTCNTTCVVYKRARVVDMEGDKLGDPFVVGGYCTAYILTGTLGDNR